MENNIPTFKKAFSSLLVADFVTQWRNRKSVLISALMVPGIILLSFKEFVATLGGAYVISSSIGLGLIGIGLMGYSTSIARDRDKEVFQRLRVAPIPSYYIMMSRLTVQLAMILLLSVAAFIGAYNIDQITLTTQGYFFGFIMSLLGGALYLSLGQALVGLIKNAETLNSTSRLVYIAIMMLGMFGDSGQLGKNLTEIMKFSPHGVVKRILSAGLDPQTWNWDASLSLLITLAYILVFCFIGLRWFKWNSSK